ncbi:hypothetical protein RFI_20175 [Reticulomyxa filosa]|uniref:Uncharacterized protein n=1 Tax=Reticulomyxa filosa TaxID=46433 RepID=X6MT40_RETFI|nr:hypothetical protein RFI_20175 [Reticulomyxa filosa]|eukprot:ETO17153.1 hypothetical protein RFI_20175 [Reticulomyxa filosa]
MFNLCLRKVWDTAGQERFQSLGTAFYRGAGVFFFKKKKKKSSLSNTPFFLYDITSAESFKNVEMWRNKLIEQGNIDKNIVPFLLCGNKSDLSAKREVPTSDAEKYAKDNGLIFFETSAVDGKNIEQALTSLATAASEKDNAPFRITKKNKQTN